MHRTPEVIDCWYDSGSMPFAQLHYPFENKELFEKYFPADFISEAIDQTRGWFYTLIAIGTLLFNRAPFENCIVMGHVQDAEGRKMSKHIGNVIDPWEVLDRQGADAVRWYFYASAAPWLPTRFSHELVSEMQRRFMGTLWNTYAFFALYASIDNYDPLSQKANPEDFTLMDRWVLSKLNSLVKFVDEGMQDYKITETARAIAAFVDELSNWYVRLGRERFWGRIVEAYRPRRVLEVGCGHGVNLQYFTQHLPARDLWGVDINEASLAAARREHPEVNVGWATARSRARVAPSMEGLVSAGSQRPETAARAAASAAVWHWARARRTRPTSTAREAMPSRTRISRPM
jgi:hypothetical protein